jgi:hypothetical protein
MASIQGGLSLHARPARAAVSGLCGYGVINSVKLHETIDNTLYSTVWCR